MISSKSQSIITMFYCRSPTDGINVEGICMAMYIVLNLTTCRCKVVLFPAKHKDSFH